jgi:fluoride ion exporter CrcB/FEX
MTTLLAILVGGFAGAVARHLASSSLQDRVCTRFPVGILAVNLSGAFVLGLLHGLRVDGSWPHRLAIGVQAVSSAHTDIPTGGGLLSLARGGAPGRLR